MKHSDLRAEERYNMGKIDEEKIIKDILDDKCVEMNSDVEKFSKTFLVLFRNRYIKVVADYNLRFIKTLLPYRNSDLDFVSMLVDKLFNNKNCKVA